MSKETKSLLKFESESKDFTHYFGECFCSISITESPFITPCNHSFHLQCMHSWLERKKECPTCRATVTIDDNQF